jgi:DNA-binding MarR family transcriptional regulator
MTTRVRLKPENGQRVAAVRHTFEQQYPAYQYQVVDFLTEHLADVSRVFRGDLQEMLVLAVIGQVYLKAYGDALLAADGSHLGQLDASISASRLADVMGIPRQTVRRKVNALAARGWIEKTGNAAVRLVASGDQSAARRDLDAIDQRAIDRVARLFCGLERLLDTSAR